MTRNTMNNTESKYRSTICCKFVTTLFASSSLLLASPALADDCVPTWHPEIGQPGIRPLPCPSMMNLYALAVFNGDLYAGGNFWNAGWSSAGRIARWDGASWHPILTDDQNGVGGTNTEVSHLLLHDEDMVVGGFFATAGGKTVNNIARWDGSTWHEFIAGGQIGVNSTVNASVKYGNDLIVGGAFTTAGGKTVNRIARWDGVAWHPLTSGGEIGVGATQVHALAVYDTDLVAGGSFVTAGGQVVNNIARWDVASGSWHPFVSGGQVGVNGTVRALAVFNGDLIVGGTFTTAGGQTVNRIARWDGSDWHSLSSGLVGGSNQARCLTVHNGDLIVGGSFTMAGDATVNNIGRWDGRSWHPFVSDEQVGVSASRSVLAFVEHNGLLIAGGTFTTAGTQLVNHIAAWGGCARGACCVNGNALELTPDECAAAGGVFHGANVPPGSVVCDAPCPADLTGSGSIGVADLLQLLSAWGPCP